MDTSNTHVHVYATEDGDLAAALDAAVASLRDQHRMNPAASLEELLALYRDRHPLCLITRLHPSHKMWSAGGTCGGAPWTPRPPRA